MLFAEGARKTIREYEIISISAIFCLLVSRSAFPPLKYFLLLLVPFYIYLSIIYRKRLVETFLHTAKFFLIPFVLLAVLIFCYFNSDKLYIIVFKDIANAILLLSVIFFTAVVTRTVEDLTKLCKYSIRVFVFFGIVVSISGLLDYFEIRFYEKFLQSFLTDISAYDFKYRDNNLYALPVIFGFIGILSSLTTKRSSYYVAGCILTLLLFTTAIFFSGSRRAMTVLVMIGLVLLFNLLLFPFDKNYGRMYLRKYSGSYFILAFLFVLTNFLFVRNASPSFKYRSLEFLGVENIPLVKERIEKSIFNYVYVFNNNITYSKIKSAIWTPDFIPEDPDSGWGSARHKTVYPLAGKLSGMVPPGSKGYLIDKRSYSGTIDSTSYANTELWRFNNDYEFTVHASVYCYVSEDFNGEGARIFSRGMVSGNTFSDYDLSRKGEWQKLEIAMKSHGETDINVALFKRGKDLEKLDGHVVFAYPEVRTRKYSFDPNDPDSGWGTTIHKTVYPLTGENSEIIPQGAKGYMLDRNSNGSWDPNSNTCESYTLIDNPSSENRSTFKASVYCYVSEDFDGNNVLMVLGWSAVQNKVVSGKSVCSYDFSRKGTWQKLEMLFSITDGQAPVYLNVNKQGVQDFKSLSGHVIFAYPLCEPYIATVVRSGMSFTLPGMFQERKRFISNVLREDTTYNGYSEILFIDDSEKEFASDRVSRLKFGIAIFEQEYDPGEKIMGGGFNFISWYGYFFLQNRQGTDYPHNPFLSVLLYSGIIGLIIYMLFLFKIFRIYFLYLRQYSIYFIFFLITFYFSFFSGGSPFDPPVMGFFSLLPFLIHSVHKGSMKES